jgi:malonate transporter and related proteins
LSAILNSVVPLFAVIFLGFFAGKARFLSEDGIRGLVAFIFHFAMPPLLFRLMARTDVAAVGEWSFVAGYLVTEVAMFALGAVVGGLVFRMRFADMVIQGFGSAFSNGVLLTLPLLLWLYGEAGGVPALLIITLNVITFSLITMLLEAAEGGGGSANLWQMALQTARSIARNPIIMAAATGLLYGLTGLGLPDVLDKTLSFIGGAAAPTALFALGASLSLRRISGSLGPALTMVANKLAVHPLLAWLIFALLLDLDPLWVNAGVIFAASPVGLNVYIFAQHYEANVESASTAILLSTGLAMLTITGLLLALPQVSG